jgi:acetyltransferase-like isoleucine patch superfamily enzyme
MVATLLNALGGNKILLRGVGNTVEYSGSLLRRVRVTVNGDNNKIRIAPGARLSNMVIQIAGSRHVLDIGADCVVKAGTVCMDDDDGRLAIGDNTTIENVDIAVTESGRVEIGRDCMLAFGIDIRNGDSHAIMDAGSGERVNRAEDIRLDDHVWIGAHVQVLKGSTVGSGSVVGARSLVCGAIPAGVVSGGIPARTIRANIRWSRKRD